MNHNESRDTSHAGSATGQPGGPHSDASERYVLGAMVANPVTIEPARDIIRSIDFYRPLHAEIFRTITRLADTDQPISPAVVAEELMSSETAMRAMDDNPAGYLYVCIDAAWSLGVAETNRAALKVREHSHQRDILEATIRLTQLTQSGTNPDEAEATFQRLAALREEAAAGAGIRIRTADQFTMKGVKWTWAGRIPAGMVTLLAGREGIGKSTVSLDIAARLTRGTLDGRYAGQPQNVILIATEDSWEHTIKPRLVAVGADLPRILHLSVEDEAGGSRSITAPGDIRAIEKAIADHAPRLMVIDPFISVIDGRVDTHRQQEVQQALEPLVQMCARTMMSVLALIHVNKSGGTDALNSVMGSKAFTTLPRSVLYAIADTDQPGSFLLSHEKCNVGPHQETLVYRIDSVRIDLDPADLDEGDETFTTTSRIVWDGVDERRAGEVMAEANTARNSGELRQELKAFIDGQNSAVSISSILAEFDGTERQAIDRTLSRMVKRGEVDKPAAGGRGLYQSVKLRPRT